MTATWIDVVGWLGAVLLLAAYGLTAARKLAGHSAAFHALNLAGSAGLAANSAANHAFPSAALNAIWMAIGVIALVRAKRPASRDA
jgi:hypothetical protein